MIIVFNNNMSHTQKKKLFPKQFVPLSANEPKTEQTKTAQLSSPQQSYGLSSNTSQILSHHMGNKQKQIKRNNSQCNFHNHVGEKPYKPNKGPTGLSNFTTNAANSSKLNKQVSLSRFHTINFTASEKPNTGPPVDVKIIKSKELKETSSTEGTNTPRLLNAQKSLPQLNGPSFLRRLEKKSSMQPKGMPSETSQLRDSITPQRFQILKKLGNGKSGNVYLVRDKISSFLMAMKVISKKQIIKNNLMNQFIQELKIQTFLNHPNIIKIYSVFADANNFYIVQELGCEGQLYALIQKGATYSEEAISFIAKNLFDAIQQMHKHNILHRDLKAENIVLSFGNVKLCDFGWAASKAKKQDMRSTFCGTPLYLAPEILKGSKYNEKVDIWAIGILCFELYFGTQPFNINEYSELFKIINCELVFPKDKPISKEFELFFRKVLEKNPQTRWSCQQILSSQFIRTYNELQTSQELCR